MLKWLKTALPKTVIEWVHLFWMIVAGALVIFLIQALVQAIWLNTDFKQWDFLAFTGSIIGGVITWWGVHASIKHSAETVNRERKEKEVEEAAKKTRILDTIDRGLGTIQDKLSQDGFTVLIYEGQENYRQWLKSTHKGNSVNEVRQYVNDSVEVDANAYKILLRLEISFLDVFRRDALFFNSVDHEPVLEPDDINEYRDRIKRLWDEINETRTLIKEIRRQYLLVLFPNDDPDMFIMD